jgi:hypothetical protein
LQIFYTAALYYINSYNANKKYLINHYYSEARYENSQNNGINIAERLFTEQFWRRSQFDHLSGCQTGGDPVSVVVII